MNRPMGRELREGLLTALTALTVWVALWSWHSVAAGMSFALPTLTVTGIVVAAAGAGMRLLRWKWYAVVLVQLVLAWSVVSIRLVHTPLPIRGMPLLHLEDAFLEAGNAADRYAPPVPVEHGILALVLCGAGVAFVLADLLARTLHRPPLVGLALLAVLAVPFSVVGGGVSPWVFALTAAGFLGQIVVEESGRVTRWGRSIDGPERVDAATRTGWRGTLGAAAVGTTATALALVVPLGIPTLHLDLSGIGNGTGGSHVTVTNPMVDLHRDLVQGADVPLLVAKTRDPDPTYLRIAVLTRFTDSQWTAGDRSIPRDQDAVGDLPVAGVDPSVARTTYTYQITAARNFVSRWLPTPDPTTHINAVGDWRYDSNTMDFIAADKSLTTAGLSYTATKAKLSLSGSQLMNTIAGVGQVPAYYTELPADLPKLVSQLAKQVTRDQTSAFGKAVALQSWFRTDGGFHYSTATTLGSGTDDLVTFLRQGPDGRTGYCQQFAAAMAVMARTLGIPARVAVGFLAPTQASDGSYVYSSHDMHAWPELYFAGAGWVRFEPTPAVRGTAAPSYTHNLSAGTPEIGDVEEPSDQPTTRPSTSAQLRQAQRHQAPKQAAAPTHRTSHHVAAWLSGGIGLLVVAAALTLPATVRRRRRARRLTGDPEAAWAEVRDTMLDLWIPWADGVSPRTNARLMSTYIGTWEGKEALGRLVSAVERERYGRSYGRSGAEHAAADDARLIMAGLRTGASPGTVRRAAWWPRTALRPRPGQPVTVLSDESTDGPDVAVRR
jgi:transglutaminase-like putative cysteine protease